MDDYLLTDRAMTVQNKTNMFAFCCNMNILPNNVGNTELCEISCQEEINNEQLLSCKVLNEGKSNNLELEQLRNGNIADKKKVSRKFQQETKIHKNKNIMKYN